MSRPNDSRSISDRLLSCGYTHAKNKNTEATGKRDIFKSGSLVGEMTVFEAIDFLKKMDCAHV